MPDQIKPDDAKHVTKANEMWQSMTDNDKAVIRFGMFPHEQMMASEREGYNGQQLAVAIMKCVKADGGMRA